MERFTYTVSHDLKSPLITIRGFLGLLEKDMAAGDARRLKEDIAHIQEAVRRMQMLLDELLTLSRVGRLSNPPQEISMSELAREAVDQVAGQIAERDVRVVIAPDLPRVYGDYPRLLEVLQNLVDNAVKFAGDQPEPRVEIGAREEGEEPIFFVRDNGIGIDPRYHQKIFGLFERLSADTEGTGIGLALVKRIIEVHGGRIWVESAIGQGTTFLFTLPQKGQ
jgi:signal transduction histidine kinase